MTDKQKIEEASEKYQDEMREEYKNPDVTVFARTDFIAGAQFGVELMQERVTQLENKLNHFAMSLRRGSGNKNHVDQIVQEMELEALATKESV